MSVPIQSLPPFEIKIEPITTYVISFPAIRAPAVFASLQFLSVDRHLKQNSLTDWEGKTRKEKVWGSRWNSTAFEPKLFPAKQAVHGRRSDFSRVAKQKKERETNKYKTGMIAPITYSGMVMTGFMTSSTHLPIKWINFIVIMNTAIMINGKEAPFERSFVINNWCQ